MWTAIIVNMRIVFFSYGYLIFWIWGYVMKVIKQKSVVRTIFDIYVFVTSTGSIPLFVTSTGSIPLFVTSTGSVPLFVTSTGSIPLLVCKCITTYFICLNSMHNSCLFFFLYFGWLVTLFKNIDHKQVCNRLPY